MKRKGSYSTGSRKRTRRSYGRRTLSKYRSSLTRVPEMRFLRKWKLSTWIWNTTSTAGFWRVYNPSLSDMPATERNEIANMFDEYKINRVKFEFVPRYTNFDAGSSTTNPAPIFHMFTDGASGNITPSGSYDQASLNNFSARANNAFRTVVANDVVKMSYKPSVQTTDGEVKPFPWTSTSINGVPAQALQVYLLGVNFSNILATTEFDVMVTFDISVRALR